MGKKVIIGCDFSASIVQNEKNITKIVSKCNEVFMNITFKN